MADTQTAPEQWRQLTPAELRFMEMPKGVRCVECKSLGGFHKATCRSTSRYEVPSAPPVAMSTPTEPECPGCEFIEGLKALLPTEPVESQVVTKCNQLEPVVGEARTAADSRENMRLAWDGFKHLFIDGSHSDPDWCRVCGEERSSDIHVAALPGPQEPVQTEAREAAKRCPGCGWPVADVPSGDTGLPWLPQPDSEGWWWRKFGPDAVPREVKRLLGSARERELYVPSLGNYADYCGGEWQKVIQPSEIKKEEA